MLGKRDLLARAKENESRMNGPTDPVLQIIEGAQLVFAVWSDENLPDGIGFLIVKGEHRLNGIADSGSWVSSGAVELPTIKPQTTVDAVLCDSANHAAALRLVLGEVG
jgi:hypothetical protein